MAVGALLPVLVLTLFSGCKKNTSSRPPQPVVSSPRLEPAAISTASADDQFRRQAYSEAAAEYEAYLEAGGAAEIDVLLRLAMSYALGADSDRNYQKTIELLQRISDSVPAGPVTATAKMMLDLMSENRAQTDRIVQKDKQIKELTEELERLRKIDLRRRPPE